MKCATVILAFLVFVLGTQLVGRADAPAAVQKWEYLEVKKSAMTPSFIDKCNEVGREGWEFVAPDFGGGALFKRPLK